ncbi:MAG TPA: threonine/serine dehydratase [Gemmatimonadaceae bacterium]|jgi:threonine dehydratase|nr:threonine/serine dehydratase [Gemmatimonadaceae bacterium]
MTTPPLSARGGVDRGWLAGSIVQAHERLSKHIRRTPCDVSLSSSERYGADIWLKGEHLQHAGSFKTRGATNKLLSLTPDEKHRGIIAASTGNHGASVAWAGRALEIPVRVYVPNGASPAKVEMIRRYGADVQMHGTDGLDAELFGRAFAAENGMPYISPYNDPVVVAGQGTVGVELAEQMETVDTVIIAVGGGGLIGGTAAYLKSIMPNVRVIGASPVNSPVMALSVRAGYIVEFASEPTLSDGTAGGVEQGAITFELCRTLVDEWVEVTEREIATAMRDFIADHHQLIEGSAAVALAALAQRADALRGQRVAVVLCGSNIGIETLRAVLAR